jgi:hypothetical protein
MATVLTEGVSKPDRLCAGEMRLRLGVRQHGGEVPVLEQCERTEVLPPDVAVADHISPRSIEVQSAVLHQEAVVGVTVMPEDDRINSRRRPKRRVRTVRFFETQVALDLHRFGLSLQKEFRDEGIDARLEIARQRAEVGGGDDGTVRRVVREGSRDQFPADARRLFPGQDENSVNSL